MAAIIEKRALTKRFAALMVSTPDGAGKTTTLRMLFGLMDPTARSATVAGHDVARESQAVKDRIGWKSNMPAHAEIVLGA